MKHSRPGFATRSSDAVPAKLNPDMIPAINRNAKTEAAPRAEQLQARAEAAMARLAKNHPVPAAPEILVNPTPSATPRVNEPGK
jgi:hypothetical protein